MEDRNRGLPNDIEEEKRSITTLRSQNGELRNLQDKQAIRSRRKNRDLEKTATVFSVSALEAL